MVQHPLRWYERGYSPQHGWNRKAGAKEQEERCLPCSQQGLGPQGCTTCLGLRASSRGAVEGQSHLSKVSLLSGYSAVSKLISMAFCLTEDSCSSRCPACFRISNAIFNACPKALFSDSPRQTCKCTHPSKVNFINICSRKEGDAREHLEIALLNALVLFLEPFSRQLLHIPLAFHHLTSGHAINIFRCCYQKS